MQSNQRPDKQPLKITLKLNEMFTTEQFAYTDLKGMFVPLLLDQLFIFLMSMLSTAMVSSSGEAAISAVSMVSSLSFIVSALFSGISTGGSIVVSRARGSGDMTRVRTAIGQTLFSTTIAALVMASIFTFAAKPIIAVLFPKAEPILIEYATTYMRLMSISYIPFGIYNATIAVFRGLGDSKSSLALTIIINTSHLLLSYLLITALDGGVTGAGLSYIYARVIGAVAALVWLFFVRKDLQIRFRHVFKVVKDMQASIFRLGIPVTIEQILFQVGMLLTQVYIALLPTSTIAANGIAGSAFGLFNAVGFSLTTIVTTVCGQCIGAKRFDLASHYVQAFIKASRYLLLAALLIFSPLMPFILRLYSPSAEALPQVYLALAIGIVPMPLLWGSANLPGAAMRAAGDASYVTVVSLAAMWISRVMVGYLLTITLGLGIAGVWISMVGEWLIRIFLLRPRLRSGKWLQKAS